MAGIVIVFDFDKTIIDCDSDNFVIDELGVTDLFNQLLQIMPWNSVMDRMMKELYLQGKSVDEIAEVLKRVPIHPHIVPAIRSAHAFGCELRVVSDANLFFIETILNHYGIRQCFSGIDTNPGFVDDEGRLRIFAYHDFNVSPHGCDLCPPNMCKGKVMERILGSQSIEEKKVIYLGDGIGDYCPSLKLREGDYVMPRKGYPVWDLICQNPMLVKANIHEWNDGEQLAQILHQLITIISNSSELINSSECKLQTMSSSAQEVLPISLPVSY